MADRTTAAPLPEDGIPASESIDRNDPAARRIADIMRSAEPAAAVPPSEHPAFAELQAHLNFLQLGSEALKGIGALMQPEYSCGNEQLNGAFRGDASAVFRFFGEALIGSAGRAYEAYGDLELASRQVRS